MDGNNVYHSPPKKIQPLNTPQTINIQSLYTYQDFLRRRPKNTVFFRFSWRYTDSKFFRGSEQKAQAKLFEVLKLLKCLKKVDLTDFQVNEFNFKQTFSESIYKKIAKVASISVRRLAYFRDAKKTFTDKWLKYLTLLENISYGLAVDANFEPNENRIITIPKSNDPLGHLKYCPKIQSLNLDIAGVSENFNKVFLKFHYFPTTSLKHLSIQSSLPLRQLNLPLEKFQQLQSVNFSLSPDHWDHYLKALSNLPLLQDLNLTIPSSLSSFEFIPIWRKITAKRQLKKLHLFLGFNFPTLPQIFDALNDCQLTHFSLRLNTSNPHLLRSISQCLNHQPQLQSLKLQICNSFYLNEAAGFPEICSQIPHLEVLRHLQLSFIPQGHFADTEKLPCFIPYFQKTFSKPIKIETLSLSCHQADPETMLKELISGLQYSASSLQRLKLDLLCPPEDNSLVKLLSSLENIRELELPGFHIKDQKAFKILIETVEILKNLRVLEIGRVGGTVTELEYAAGIERISKKRGLRRFVCRTEKQMDYESLKINVKGILRKNPFLQVSRISRQYLEKDWNREIYTWI